METATKPSIEQQQPSLEQLEAQLAGARRNQALVDDKRLHSAGRTETEIDRLTREAYEQARTAHGQMLLGDQIAAAASDTERNKLVIEYLINESRTLDAEIDSPASQTIVMRARRMGRSALQVFGTWLTKGSRGVQIAKSAAITGVAAAASGGLGGGVVGVAMMAATRYTKAYAGGVARAVEDSRSSVGELAAKMESVAFTDIDASFTHAQALMQAEREAFIGNTQERNRSARRKGMAAVAIGAVVGTTAGTIIGNMSLLPAASASELPASGGAATSYGDNLSIKAGYGNNLSVGAQPEYAPVTPGLQNNELLYGDNLQLKEPDTSYSKTLAFVPELIYGNMPSLVTPESVYGENLWLKPDDTEYGHTLDIRPEAAYGDTPDIHPGTEYGDTPDIRPESEYGDTPPIADEDNPPRIDNGAEQLDIPEYTVAKGEGWYQTFCKLGVDSDHSAELLKAIGPKLTDMGVAYPTPDGLWGISAPGELPEDATRLILETAHDNNWLEGTESVELEAEPLPIVDKGEGLNSFMADNYDYQLSSAESMELGEELNKTDFMYKSQALADGAGQGNPYGISEPGAIDKDTHNTLLDFADDGELNNSVDTEAVPDAADTLADDVAVIEQANLRGLESIDPADADWGDMKADIGNIIDYLNKGAIDEINSAKYQDMLGHLWQDLWADTYVGSDMQLMSQDSITGRYSFNPIPEGASVPDHAVEVLQKYQHVLYDLAA